MEAVIFFIWLIWPVMSGTIAHSKNRNWFGWAVLGGLIGIFAVIWLACLPALDESNL